MTRLIAETEAARPPFDKTAEFTVTQTPNVAFRPGGGLNDVPCCGRAADFHTVNPETYDTAKIYKVRGGEAADLSSWCPL